MRRLRPAVAASVLCLLMSACGTSSSPTTTQSAPTTEAAAQSETSTPPDITPPDSTTPETSPAIDGSVGESAEVDRPVTNEPGETSLAVLTQTEICSLIPDDEAKQRWGLSTSLTSKGWTQTDSSTSCSQIFAEEPTDGPTPNVAWEMMRGTQSSWPTADPDYKRTVKDTTVGGRPALVVTSEKGDLGSKDVEVYVAIDDSMSLQVKAYGGEKMLDATKLIAQAEQIVGRIPTLNPTPEPARDAPVGNVFELTGGQLCALLRPSTAASLLTDNRPSGTSSYLVLLDSLSCSIGSAKLGIDILGAEPFVIEETTRTPTKVGDLDAVWDKPSLEGTKAEPGAEVQYVSLLVKWRDVWIAIQARAVVNTTEVERVVLEETTHVLRQLDSIVKP